MLILTKPFKCFSETTFGTTQSGDENQTSHFVESANEYAFIFVVDILSMLYIIYFISRLMHVAGMFWTKPWYHIKPIFWMTKEYTKMSRSRAFTRDYATKVKIIGNIFIYGSVTFNTSILDCASKSKGVPS